VLDSIVKVFCVYSRSDWLLPWQAHPKREGTGTGFVIRDRLILTNAHVVAGGWGGRRPVFGGR
jgi:S1-C subfamily serine protease